MQLIQELQQQLEKALMQENPYFKEGS